MNAQPNLDELLMKLRSDGGFCRLAEYGLIEIYGPDAARFLQSQTSNDVSALPEMGGQGNALLDRKAHVKAVFDLYRHHTSYRIVAEKAQIENILSHLETYRFADKVEFLDCAEKGTFFAVQGAKVREACSEGLSGKPAASAFDLDLCDLKLWHANTHVFKKSITAEEGFLIWVSGSESDEFEKSLAKTCEQHGMVELTSDVLNVARVEGGIPSYGVDFNEENILPETGLDQQAVSYTKGCFQGQEVLARVRSQGAPSKALVGLLFAAQSKETFAPGSKVLTADAEQEIATLKSCVYSPTLGRTIAFALIKRDYRVVGKTIDVSISGHKCAVTVTTPPFYRPQSAQEKAKALLAAALQKFAQEKEDVVESDSVTLLRQAIELDPKLEDAFEALGVILSKRGRLEEAVALMKRLADINPDSTMAHTNLSVFYMEQGLKEAAEEEKAISMSIRMRLAAKEASRAMKDKEEAKKKEEETQQRLSMFREVLVIDSEDLLANYGVGSCLVALGQPAEAVAFLEKAIAIKPSHTVAYPSLAEAYASLKQNDKAIQTLEKGIEVASKRGDMMPLSDMQKQLAQLQATPVKP